jgi:hypothetical protein
VSTSLNGAVWLFERSPSWSFRLIAEFTLSMFQLAWYFASYLFVSVANSKHFLLHAREPRDWALEFSLNGMYRSIPWSSRNENASRES